MRRALYASLLAACAPFFAMAHEPLDLLQVEITGTAQVDALSELGVFVDNVTPTSATVYATPEQRQALDSLGWRYTVSSPPSDKQGSGYHDYAAVQARLEQVAANFPTITRLYSLGQSVQGRELWALLITDNPDTDEDEPEFKYVSTIHGDENLATEMCLRFIDHLLSNYCVEDRETWLIDETAIWIVPVMNPDGLTLNRRTNANGVDLNRAFPIFGNHFGQNYFNGGALSIEGRQPEVARIMQWSLENSFVLSANLHTGAVVVNYPYDDEEGVPSGVAAPSPDEDLFYNLSRRYAVHNVPMSSSLQFPGGVTNGSAWYRITGGMQDWNYRYLSCKEVTLELADPKRPSSSLLDQYWEDNRESMLAYLESVHIGVRGIVSDQATGAPLWTEVTVQNNAQPVYSDPDVGDYYRLLLPGTYTLQFDAPGYILYTAPNVVVSETGAATRLDVQLSNGDINGDGRIDAADIQHVLAGVLKQETPYKTDIDGRGDTTVSDLQIVVNLALGRVQL